MNMWLGGLFCLFLGMMLLMDASSKIPTLNIKNKWQGAGLGCGITFILQSSSAVSCSVCAMAQNGTIALSAAFAVLVGSNVGTCITPFLTALGLEMNSFDLLFPLLGLLIMVLRPFFPRLAKPLAGFCLLMWGLGIMTTDKEVFTALAHNPIWSAVISSQLGAWVLGLLSTALLQSSSLTLSLLQVYTLTAPLTMDIALPFILGQNIGTTATAMLATMHDSPTARKCALYHVKFNAIGSAWALPLALLFRGQLGFTATPMALALAHLIYNAICAIGHLFLDKSLNRK